VTDKAHKVSKMANKIKALTQVVEERIKVNHALDRETSSLIEILHDMFTEIAELAQERDGPGRKPRKPRVLVALAACAAAVRVLKKEGGVDTAIREVAKAAGFSPKEVKNFYDSLNRGTARPGCVEVYRERLADYESMSKARIISSVKMGGDFCRE
jgi:hypothetical protein